MKGSTMFATIVTTTKPTMPKGIRGVVAGRDTANERGNKPVIGQKI